MKDLPHAMCTPLMFHHILTLNAFGFNTHRPIHARVVFFIISVLFHRAGHTGAVAHEPQVPPRGTRQ